MVFQLENDYMEYVERSAAAGALDYNQPYTWMAWVQATQTLSTSQCIWLTYGSNGSLNYDRLLFLTSADFRLRVDSLKDGGGNGGSFTFRDSPSALSAGTWYHVAIVREAENVLKCWLDGTPFDGEVDTSTAERTAVAQEYVGIYRSNGADNYFSIPGSLLVGGIKSWSRALDSAEVAAEMRSVRPVNWNGLWSWHPTPPGTDRLKNFAGTGTTRDYSTPTAIPIYVTSGGYTTTNGSDPTLTLPSCNNGDLMVAFVYTREATDGSITVPSGWDTVLTNRTAGGCLAIFKRLKQESDSNPTVTLVNHTSSNGPTGDSCVGAIFAFRNVSTTVEQQGTDYTDSGTDTSVGPIPGMTTASKPQIYVLIVGHRDNGAIATGTDTGFTWTAQGGDTTSGGDASGSFQRASTLIGGHALSDKTLAVSGSGGAEGRGIHLTWASSSSIVLSDSNVSLPVSWGAPPPRLARKAVVTHEPGHLPELVRRRARRLLRT